VLITTIGKFDDVKLTEEETFSDVDEDLFSFPNTISIFKKRIMQKNKIDLRDILDCIRSC